MLKMVMERKKYCIFACGGRGTRMGESLPKQFLRLGDKTILQLSIEKVLDAEPDVHVVVVLPQEYMEFWSRECSRSLLTVPQTIVQGGITRFHSVKNALEKIPDDTVVAVHDGVRPFCDNELMTNLFRTAQTCPAVVPVVPVVDTLKVLDTELCEKPGRFADRSELFGAQTPQLFWGETIKAAYRQPYDTSFTDDASVVKAYGVDVKYIPGKKFNLKITTPDDLLLARALLSVI